MQNRLLLTILGILFLLPIATFGYGHYTVYSTVPADVYIDNEYNASISATQTLKLILYGPQTYVIGVRKIDTGETYKETVKVGKNLNEHREIHAFVNYLQFKSEVTVYSQLPADVYVDNEFKFSVDINQPMAINLSGPRSYVFEIRAKNSNLIFREEVSIDLNTNLKREIRAFSLPTDAPIQTQTQILTQTEVSAPVAQAKGTISREEMADEIQKATAKAKAEALAEEAGRRKRAEKRALTSKGIGHVVGVEANSGLPNSVKNMERIKLLLEALPALNK
ncbi:MAG: hypothetical protein HQM10_12100 [Candidatus Riflebacteria bacterium]|nr:hypothetical protein [Candidatus Riflebacteria bacterium]